MKRKRLSNEQNRRFTFLKKAAKNQGFYLKLDGDEILWLKNNKVVFKESIKLLED